MEHLRAPQRRLRRRYPVLVHPRPTKLQERRQELPRHPVPELQRRGVPASSLTIPASPFPLPSSSLSSSPLAAASQG